MATNNATPVKMGETIKVTYPGANPRTIDVKVQGSCGDANRGQWFCSTCNIFFVNQFDKDSHLSDKPKVTHKLAWNCFEHGIEQP